jgi:hypothetical protein
MTQVSGAMAAPAGSGMAAVAAGTPIGTRVARDQQARTLDTTMTPTPASDAHAAAAHAGLAAPAVAAPAVAAPAVAAPAVAAPGPRRQPTTGMIPALAVAADSARRPTTFEAGSASGAQAAAGRELMVTCQQALAWLVLTTTAAVRPALDATRTSPTS